MTSTPTARGRTAPALLRDRNFGPFVVGKIVSSCGVWIGQIAAAVLMFELTRSAFMVGAVSMMLFAGPLLLALWTGALVDRRDRRHLLMVGRGISALAAGMLALLLVGSGVNPQVLLVSAAVMGVGHAVSLPAMQALTPGLVPDEDLEQALAFASVAPSIARTVGPALGAGLLVVGGPELAFATAALTHASFVLVLAVVRARPQRREDGRPSIFGGLRYLVHDRTTLLLMAGVAMMGFGADPVITLTPSLADRLGGGSELVGLFASVFGVGAVLVVVAFRRLRGMLTLRLVGVAGYLVVGLGLVVAAVVPSVQGAAIGFLINGAGFMMATVALTTRIQRRVPDELRGRVMALWGVAFLGSRPVAAPINGAVADLVSVQAAMLAAAAVVVAAALLARVRYP
ncbi:MAG TPA: MFS transporter [Jiangellaceae bacterium]|nr:MFS transporter [Jiangellaceae bacterium]